MSEDVKGPAGGKPAPDAASSPRRRLLVRLILVNLVLVIPVALSQKAAPGLLTDALAWFSGTACAIQFWGGIAAAILLPGWRRFGALAAASILPVVLVAVMITGFHI